jgi:hypothetical protein
VWLVDLVRERRDLSRVLRIGVCRSKQRRITAKKGAIGAEIHPQTVLHPRLLFRHTAAVRPDLRSGTDDRLPTTNNQALMRQRTEVRSAEGRIRRGEGQRTDDGRRPRSSRRKHQIPTSKLQRSSKLQVLNIQNLASSIQDPGSNLKRAASEFQRLKSDRTSKFQHPTSNIQHRTAEARKEASPHAAGAWSWERGAQLKH